MRLFAALALPAEVHAAIGERLAVLRPLLPPARWVDPAGAHLTLAFFGEADPRRLPALGDALAPVCAAAAPVAMALRDVGTFPPERPARVAWVGVEAPPSLAALQSAVAAASAAALDWQPERRPFHPHLTLARCRAPWPRGAVQRFVDAGRGAWGPPFTAAEVTLFESRLTPAGARYRREAGIALGAAR